MISYYWHFHFEGYRTCYILYDAANAIDMPFSASKTVCMVFNLHKSKRKQQLENLGRKQLKGGRETGKKRHLRA